MQETYHFSQNQQQHVLPYPQQFFPPNQQQNFLPNQQQNCIPNQQQHFLPHQQQQFPHQQSSVQHVMVLQIPLEDHPVNTSCPSCQASIITKVTTSPSAYTHLVAGILCLMCFCPCAIIPYFCNSTKNSVHTCPQCGAYIGTYNPSHRNRYRWNNRW